MINEHKKGFKAKKYLKHTKPATKSTEPATVNAKNPVAKNSKMAGKAGAHKNPKDAMTQPRKEKHKKKETMETVISEISSKKASDYINGVVKQQAGKIGYQPDMFGKLDPKRKQGVKRAMNRIDLPYQKADKETKEGQISEIKKSQKDSNGFTKCWPGKHAEGTKKGKNGGQVRNCKPNEGVAEAVWDRHSQSHIPRDGRTFGQTNHPREEHCDSCGAPTGHAGPGEDSNVDDNGNVYCDDCYAGEQGVAEGGGARQAAIAIAKKKSGKYNKDGKRIKESIMNEDIMGLGNDEFEPKQHPTHEGSMARQELYRNSKYGMDMLKMIEANDEIEPWVAANLTNAATWLDKVYHYLDYRTKFESPMDGTDEDEDIKSLKKDKGIKEEEVEANGDIARMNLQEIVEYSMKLFKMIKPETRLEGWVAMKLTKASEAVSSSKHYLEHVYFEKHTEDMYESKILKKFAKVMSKNENK